MYRSIIFLCVFVEFGLGIPEILTYGTNMSKKTVLNDSYKGLVEAFRIPAEVRERDGTRCASFGSVLPIHCCTPEQVAERAITTHHYCDIFTEQLLAPLAELLFVRLDEDYAEKVFIKRSKRILLTSSDGVLAQWRCAPAFESENRFLPGTPIVNGTGALVSVITARVGSLYAVSNVVDEGGYLETSQPWKVVARDGANVYGDRSFTSRAALRDYVAALPPMQVSPAHPPTPVLHLTDVPRLVLVAANGRQISHTYLYDVIADHIDYL